MCSSDLLILFYWIGYVGIALATSAAAWVNAALLGGRLMSEGHYQMDARLKSRLPRLLASSAAMGIGLWYGTEIAAPYLAASFWESILALGALIAGGGLLLGLAIIATGTAHMSELKAMFRRG